MLIAKIFIFFGFHAPVLQLLEDSENSWVYLRLGHNWQQNLLLITATSKGTQLDRKYV